jgi:hypothetical protein
MKRFSILTLLSLLLFSCASGPIYMAVTEQEIIKTNYTALELKQKHAENERLIKELLNRFVSLKVNFVKDGLGIMRVIDEKGAPHYYLMLHIRPSGIRFDQNTTDSKKRFSEIVYVHLPKYLSYVKKEDLSNLEGLSFGIYWPVRDFSQCQEYGGFIEYAHFNIPKEELYEFMDGKKGLREVLKGSEIIVSFDLQPPKSVRLEF